MSPTVFVLLVASAVAFHHRESILQIGFKPKVGDFEVRYRCRCGLLQNGYDAMFCDCCPVCGNERTLGLHLGEPEKGFFVIEKRFGDPVWHTEGEDQ